jgi:methylmalonyl-CoA/ethylmalonyl-CoA epimerase
MVTEYSEMIKTTRGGLRLDHVAHAVRSIRSMLPLYVDVLGGQFLRGGDNGRIGYRGVQFVLPAGGCIEIIEPLRGSGFLDSFFRRNPTGGLHHITFLACNVRDMADAAERAGYRVVAAHYGPPRDEVFLHPHSTSGVLVQLTGDGDRNTSGGPSSLEEVIGAER